MQNSQSPQSDTFWSQTLDNLEVSLGSTPRGLSGKEAQDRLARYGPNVLASKGRSNTLSLLIGQFNSPIVILLLFAAILSFFLGENTDATIILVIVVASGLLSFWQERGAADAVSKLLATVQVRASVLRDDRTVGLPVEQLVPGDVILLSAGSVIPADCRIVESKDLFVDEATLTGETYPEIGRAHV